ncbi:hypothetical protein ABB37_03465 [Leptomonas pyrrhocoris]|uniref:Right handed beta helix domain-containing protein n=1 Tax=Leptomonas pyrrhocoris TaxID=157538 RepID=A0A0N0DWZ8_LEPPY|nr:hypothetical protein ABB37_03465 [Leptomonas pyrrhocoris]XP_015660827.1 hypothetical protein ABB37_03465 [Leptomonas pyrrhocoris]KPA82387.1 hypothetical protein ABB37_03465 [Leptomonas pyrrhocoris]KPA82388.1 hypothetical protein ABB37_03465 [Leptomonas pyrrhocoris]|eukprot:XP_015660826.1 hypothetical protein ABB37_03465 [Leptomonas pyrrhocoris]
MPIKKKSARGSSKSAKEELPVPETLKNGPCVTYIGGWSSYETIESVSAVSAQVTAAHTEPDGAIAPLPRTNIFLLPTSTADAAAAMSVEEAKQPVTVVVVDHMNIEGVSRQQCGQAHGATKTWAAPAATSYDDEASGAAAAEQGETVSPVEPVNPYEDALHDTRYVQTVAVGATYAARDVVVSGSCSIEGMPPKIVVPPQLPSKPNLDAVTLDEQPETAVKDARSKKPSSAAKRSKKGKTKLTPEQVEELERKKAAIEAEYLQQTEQAMQRAQEQADYLMTFAHPDRWARVVFRHITFAGPVVVRRAHVTFQNCCFASAAVDRPQLVVSQYCRVECTKCTFEAPQRCGLYTLPSSQVTVRKCLFTGARQEVWWTADIPALALQTAGASADLSSDEAGAEAGLDDDALDPDSANTTHNKREAGGLYAPIVLAGDLKDAVHGACQQRSGAVGIQTDSAKLQALSCGFVALGVGVYVRGNYSVYMSHREAATKSAQQLSAEACDTVLDGNAFHHFTSTAVLLDKSARLVGLRRNFVEACAYYGLDCQSGSKSVLVRNNHFTTDAVVRIREGANIAFLHNDFQSIPINDNVYENPCLQPVY